MARAGASGRLTPDLSPPPPNQQQPAPGSPQPGAEGKCCNVQEMNQLELNYTQMLLVLISFFQRFKVQVSTPHIISADG